MDILLYVYEKTQICVLNSVYTHSSISNKQMDMKCVALVAIGRKLEARPQQRWSRYFQYCVNWWFILPAKAICQGLPPSNKGISFHTLELSPTTCHHHHHNLGSSLLLSLNIYCGKQWAWWFIAQVAANENSQLVGQYLGSTVYSKSLLPNSLLIFLKIFIRCSQTWIQVFHGVSIVMGVPQYVAGWFLSWKNPIEMDDLYRGTPILGTPHLQILHRLWATRVDRRLQLVVLNPWHWQLGMAWKPWLMSYWENHRKTIGKWWFYGKIIGKP